MAARGCLVTTREGCRWAPGFKVTAVDTTAAGDTFIGYFLAELLAGESTPQSLTLASRAAALCVTRPGAAVSIPRRHELEEGQASSKE